MNIETIEKLTKINNEILERENEFIQNSVRINQAKKAYENNCIAENKIPLQIVENEFSDLEIKNKFLRIEIDYLKRNLEIYTLLSKIENTLR